MYVYDETGDLSGAEIKVAWAHELGEYSAEDYLDEFGVSYGTTNEFGYVESDEEAVCSALFCQLFQPAIFYPEREMAVIGVELPGESREMVVLTFEIPTISYDTASIETAELDGPPGLIIELDVVADPPPGPYIPSYGQMLCIALRRRPS